MTTFMAKLLQKLTEMSCNLANDFIVESNGLLTSVNKEDPNRKSRINMDFPVDFMKEYDFSEEDDGL